MIQSRGFLFGSKILNCMINMIVSYLLDGLLGFLVSPSLVQYDSTLIVRVDVLSRHSIVNFVNLDPCAPGPILMRKNDDDDNCIVS